ncbi:LysR family transcriptional regulator [Streptomyces sp. NPDC046909]|uniref:LysR family transcriptional regulator n=1 Tax=Streptomyces sp. NPDC046909 TaxID=3155617 RepID=UPI0033D39429
MYLSGLDLNLVLSLRALLEERNVTRAGRRVGLSQPAMSAALGRLRRHFDDDLLVRAGGQYELTALGRVLVGRTAAACDVLERVFTSRADFVADREEREFTLLASDYAVAVFGAALARAAHTEAPGVRLRFCRPPADPADLTETALSTVDGLLLPHGLIHGFPFVDLFSDRWAVLVAETNDEVTDRLTLNHLERLPWATYRRSHDTLAARQLGALGVVPRVEVCADSFQSLPLLVSGTRRVALVQHGLAALSGLPGVRVMEPPYETPPLREAMWWHPVHTHDAGHIWLRETAARVGMGLDTAACGRVADAERGTADDAAGHVTAGGDDTYEIHPGPAHHRLR